MQPAQVFVTHHDDSIKSPTTPVLVREPKPQVTVINRYPPWACTTRSIALLKVIFHSGACVLVDAGLDTLKSLLLKAGNGEA